MDRSTAVEETPCNWTAFALLHGGLADLVGLLGLLGTAGEGWPAAVRLPSYWNRLATTLALNLPRARHQSRTEATGFKSRPWPAFWSERQRSVRRVTAETREAGKQWLATQGATARCGDAFRLTYSTLDATRHGGWGFDPTSWAVVRKRKPAEAQCTGQLRPAARPRDGERGTGNMLSSADYAVLCLRLFAQGQCGLTMAGRLQRNHNHLTIFINVFR